MSNTHTPPEPTPAKVWLVRWMPVTYGAGWQLAIVIGGGKDADFIPIPDIAAEHFTNMGVTNIGEIWEPIDQARYPGDPPGDDRG